MHAVWKKEKQLENLSFDLNEKNPGFFRFFLPAPDI